MNRHLLAVVLAVIGAGCVSLLAVRSEASASGNGDLRIVVLQKQVKTLQAQVKVLQKHTTVLDEQVQVNFAGDTCLATMTADLIQGTWIAVDQATAKTTFGPQTQVNDYGDCALLGQPSVPRTSTILTPPTINPLLPLIQWLHE